MMIGMPLRDSLRLTDRLSHWLIHDASTLDPEPGSESEDYRHRDGDTLRLYVAGLGSDSDL